MPRISTVEPEAATGDAKATFDMLKSQYGGEVPGVAQILFVEPKVAGPVFQVYMELNRNPSSRMSSLQREMVATLVNGVIGGSP